MKNGKEKIKKLLKIIKKDYPVETFFIISNLINGLIIRIVTVKNGLFISHLLVDLGFLILVSLLSLLIKKEKRIRYIITL